MRKRSSNPAFRVANNGRCSTAEWSGSRQQLLDKRAWMLRRLRFPPASFTLEHRALLRRYDKPWAQKGRGRS